MVKRILSCHFSGLLVFAGVMALVFHITFNVAGDALRGLLARCITAISAATGHLLVSWNVPELLHSLIMDGIFPGVGSVLSFVPIIGLLFFFLSLMEESGYLLHASKLFDGPMERLGLTGRAVVPMIMGFGCNVPAIMAADSLPNGRQRTAVIAMIPFMSCSARLPIYAMFISTFFEDHRLLALAAVYLVGITAAVMTALLMKRLCGKDDFRTGIVPCHPGSGNSCRPGSSERSAAQRLRFPFSKNVLRAVLRTVWQNCAGFIKKACTVILLASVIIWFLRTFGAGLQPVADMGHSLLASLGKAASPVFEPLGFEDWRASSALISGLFAKETIISTLALLSADGSSSAVYAAAFSGGPSALLAEAFTPLSAFCFMVFCLLYVPCIPTLATIRQQTGSLRFCIILTACQLITAWIVSFLLFHIAGFIMQV